PATTRRSPWPSTPTASGRRCSAPTARCRSPRDNSGSGSGAGCVDKVKGIGGGDDHLVRLDRLFLHLHKVAVAPLLDSGTGRAEPGRGGPAPDRQAAGD